MNVRYAQCASCKKRVLSDSSLPFFQDRSAGTQDDRCMTCRYNKCAHDPAHMEALVRKRDGSRYATVVEDGRCSTGFLPMEDGYEFDSFYCGCRGWD